SVVVKVQDGTAWLSGSVANQRQMASALQIAHQSQGVDLVVNNLNIGNSAPAASKSNESNPRQQVMQASLEQPEHAAPRTLAGSSPQKDDQSDSSSGQWSYDDPRAMPQDSGNAQNCYAPN